MSIRYPIGYGGGGCCSPVQRSWHFGKGFDIMLSEMIQLRTILTTDSDKANKGVKLTMEILQLGLSSCQDL